jgi:hypothetical protein
MAMRAEDDVGRPLRSGLLNDPFRGRPARVKNVDFTQSPAENAFQLEELLFRVVLPNLRVYLNVFDGGQHVPNGGGLGDDMQQNDAGMKRLRKSDGCINDTRGHRREVDGCEDGFHGR